MKSNIGSLNKISYYLKPYKLMIIGVMVSLLVTSGTVLMISKALQYFIDHGIAEKNTSNLNLALLALIAIVLLLAIFTFARFYLVTSLGEKVIADIRTDIFNHILKLSPEFFEETKTGEIISRLTVDTTLLLSIIGSSISVAMRNFIMLVGGIALMAATNIYLTAVIFFMIPIIILPIYILGRHMKKLARESQDKMAELTSICEQSVSSIKTIQSYVRQEFESEKFVLKVSEQLQTAYKRIGWRGLMTAIVISLAFGGIAIVLGIGGHQVISGRITSGELSAFIYISVLCAASAAALSETAGDLYKAAGATERLFEFLNAKPTVVEVAIPHQINIDDNRIEFRDVTFSYCSNKNKLVLDNCSFDVEPGKITAIVGKSGAGKTTILNLLERFYDISSGSIVIGGIDIRQLRLNDLRSLFTYVSQDPAIFAASVRDNILYGNPTASDAELVKAAEDANCMEFIGKLPQHFDSYLGERGVKLSGGQKQRISIARAILRNPKILLLDEATSSLDSENEELVHKALSNLMKNRTTIVIAHRLSTIQNADKIIVLDNGKVAESGTHNALVGIQGGVYAKLAKLQFNTKIS